MNSRRWRQVKRSFEAALALKGRDRELYLQELGRSDEELLREVRALLDSHRQAEDFIESPAFPGLAGADTESQESSWVGKSLGSYRVLEELGRGGMGVVYVGERADDQYRKKVAIKRIIGGASDPLLLSRFRQERQILASLDHPGIARLLDGGATEEGQPYLVMEMIDGESIDQYCNSRGLGIRQRVRLFRKICDAVHYAHQHLVIHRDIKPSNILVTAEGEPKLLDFGTAKLLDPGPTPEGLPPTVTLLRPMTPEFASPEQLQGKPITTASDVYSLGVVLYGLLSGAQPYSFEDRYSLEALRVVVEDEPLPPSARYRDEEREGSKGGLGGQGPSGGRLSRALWADMDKIILMALRKDPGRRYATVDRLAEDLRRWGEGLPIRARKDTLGYRLMKLVQRHKLGAAALVLALVGIFAGAGLAFWQARVAIGERSRVEQVAELLLEVIEQADPVEGEAALLSTREVLDERTDRIRERLAAEPRLQARMLSAIGEVYSNWGLHGRSAQLLEESLELRLGLLGPEHLGTAESQDRLGAVYYQLGRDGEAGTMHQRALASRSLLLGKNDPLVAESLNNLAAVYFKQGRLGEAEEHLRRALVINRQAFGDVHRQVGITLNNLASLLFTQGQTLEAGQVFEEVLAIHRHLVGSSHPTVADALGNLAAVRHHESRLEEAKVLAEEALVIRREILGERHPDVALSLANLAGIEQAAGEVEAARALYQQALSLAEASIGPEHEDTLYYRSLLESLPPSADDR